MAFAGAQSTDARRSTFIDASQNTHHHYPIGDRHRTFSIVAVGLRTEPSSMTADDLSKSGNRAHVLC